MYLNICLFICLLLIYFSIYLNSHFCSFLSKLKERRSLNYQFSLTATVLKQSHFCMLCFAERNSPYIVAAQAFPKNTSSFRCQYLVQFVVDGQPWTFGRIDIVWLYFCWKPNTKINLYVIYQLTNNNSLKKIAF